MNRLNWDDHMKFEVDWWRKFPNSNIVVSVHADFFQYIYSHYCISIHSHHFNRALEIGLGASGGYLGIIQSIGERYGLDPLVDELKDLLPYKKQIKYYQGTAEELPFADGFFDLVIISNAIDHCIDPQKVANEMKRVLSKNGVVLIFNYLNEDKNHPHSYSHYNQVRELFKLRVVEEHYFAARNRFRQRNPYYVGIYKK